MTDLQSNSSLRCTAEEIAMVLRDVAKPGSRVVVNRKVQEWGEACVWVTTDRLWRVGLWRRAGEGLVRTLDAVSPDRRDWQWGCQRRWLEDGGVIEPLALLSEMERRALDQRLVNAVGLPSQGVCPMWTPGGLEGEPGEVKPARKPKKRRKPAKGCQSS